MLAGEALSEKLIPTNPNRSGPDLQRPDAAPHIQHRTTSLFKIQHLANAFGVHMPRFNMFIRS